MPGNKTTFQDAMNKATNAAWDKQWQKAAAEYRRALAEFPNDLSVRLSLAHALEESGQMESALREYMHLAQAQPTDPTPLMHVASLQKSCAAPPMRWRPIWRLPIMHLKTQLRDKAIEAWHQVAVLEPDRLDVHQKLAEVYEQLATPLASKESGDWTLALQEWRQSQASSLAEPAIAIDPANQEARVFLEELRPTEAALSESSTPSPILQAEKEALSRLAETLLTDREANDVFDEAARRRIAPDDEPAGNRFLDCARGGCADASPCCRRHRCVSKTFGRRGSRALRSNSTWDCFISKTCGMTKPPSC